MLERHPDNPILTPEETNEWESEAVFNGSIAPYEDGYVFVYRAVSGKKVYFGNEIELSSIGIAKSQDGVTFTERKLFISPEFGWEEFGCEDPRITKIGDTYYIFYTALSDYPHTPDGIKIGVAVTKDFIEVKKYQVTNFNSKAMGLFPEKINGKFAAILTVNTDRPPSKIAIAYFDNEDDMWKKEVWDKWLLTCDKHCLSLTRSERDHVEVGGAPIKTDKGWLLVYSYIKDYFTGAPIFGIEAALLSLDDPSVIVATTKEALMVPYEEYERLGKVPNIVFPSGTFLNENGVLNVYYSCADTSVGLAQVKLDWLLAEMFKNTEEKNKAKLERYEGNPIIVAKEDNYWEQKATFNPTAVYLDGKVHILYRALSADDTSTIGYAISGNGFSISERLAHPVYVPREKFEVKATAGYSGCEDPRLTLIGDTLYMCYTAYSGEGATHIGLTSISTSDFLAREWNWSSPVVISDPARSDKNCCLLSEKINDKYVFFHRIGGCIWVDYVDSLDFEGGNYLGGRLVFCPTNGGWESEKVGIAGAPIKTDKGWLLIYHALSVVDKEYRLSAMLLKLDEPHVILKKLNYPILEPELNYEKSGVRPSTVFSCGGVVIEDKLYVYYGASDQVVCVATINLEELLSAFD